MFNFIRKWLRKKSREHDVKEYWQACQSTGDLYYARTAFLNHCLKSSDWTIDYSDDRILTFVNSLQLEKR